MKEKEINYVILMTHTYLQHFFFQSAYNFIGLLFAAAAFRLIENNKNIFMYLLAVFLLFIGVSSYHFINYIIYYK